MNQIENSNRDHCEQRKLPADVRERKIIPFRRGSTDVGGIRKKWSSTLELPSAALFRETFESRRRIFEEGLQVKQTVRIRLGSKNTYVSESRLSDLEHTQRRKSTGSSILDKIRTSDGDIVASDAATGKTVVSSRTTITWSTNNKRTKDFFESEFTKTGKLTTGMPAAEISSQEAESSENSNDKIADNEKTITHWQPHALINKLYEVITLIPFNILATFF